MRQEHTNPHGLTAPGIGARAWRRLNSCPSRIGGDPTRAAAVGRDAVCGGAARVEDAAVDLG
jgi:hypothetical protein